MTEASTSEQLEAALRQFTGTEHWYRHPLYRTFCYTDGVKYLAEAAGAYWLIDDILACQIEPRIKNEAFQFWTLTVTGLPPKGGSLPLKLDSPIEGSSSL